MDTSSRHHGYHLILLDAPNVAQEESIESMKNVDTATDQDIKEKYALNQQADKTNRLFYNLPE